MDLKFAIDNSLNVLLVGPHGCGKTTRPLTMWREMGIPHLFFNAPVMDPYEDLRGIPVEKNGVINYLKASHINWEDAEFILIDEPNRAHPKVVNTFYELIQFKTINGQKLPKLKAVWCAMNPPEQYAVEILDDSFYDRFHCVFNVKPQLNEEFFLNRFSGFLTKEMFEKLLVWWHAVPDAVRLKHVSPRRVEYAVEVVQKGGQASFSLPSITDTDAFHKALELPKPPAPPRTGMMTMDEALEYLIRAEDKKLQVSELKDIQFVPDEILMSRYSRNTRMLNEAVAYTFMQDFDKIKVNLSLVISCAKCHWAGHALRMKASNYLKEKAPGLARSLHII